MRFGRMMAGWNAGKSYRGDRARAPYTQLQRPHGPGPTGPIPSGPGPSGFLSQRLLGELVRSRKLPRCSS
jgi:hypothetical protein